MLVGRFLWHQKHKDKVHRLAVQRIEIDFTVQLQQGADRFMAIAQAAVRDGYAITKASGAKLFAGYQAFINSVWIKVSWIPPERPKRCGQGSRYGLLAWLCG